MADLIEEFLSRDALMQAAADALAVALEAGVNARGHACAALSGGTTPEPAYAMLAAKELDWPKVTFALVDERFVPPDHEASNERLLRRALAPALDKGATLLPMYAYEANLEAAAARANGLDAPREIDIALLGMGEDGHTASWFPGAAELGKALDPATAESVIAVNATQAAGAPERLTLTRAALMRAHALVLLITGPAKADVLRQAAAGVDYPIGALLAPPAPPLRALWAN